VRPRCHLSWRRCPKVSFALASYLIRCVILLTSSDIYVPDFLIKVREGKAKAAGSGFGGKGLDKFEAERESKDRAERAFYGEDGARVEKGAGAAATTANDASKDKGKDGAAAGGTVPPDYGFDFKVEIVKGAAPDKVAPAAGGSSVSKTPATAQSTLGADVSKLPAQTLAALQRAEAAGRGGNVMENLQSAVARITASLNKTKAEKNAATQASQPAKSSDATEYHAIVPINDYPQKARWKATNKEQMVQLQELSGASITNKGESRQEGGSIEARGISLMHCLVCFFLCRYLLRSWEGAGSGSRTQTASPYRKQRRVPSQIGRGRTQEDLVGCECGCSGEYISGTTLCKCLLLITAGFAFLV